MYIFVHFPPLSVNFLTFYALLIVIHNYLKLHFILNISCSDIAAVNGVSVIKSLHSAGTFQLQPNWLYGSVVSDLFSSSLVLQFSSCPVLQLSVWQFALFNWERPTFRPHWITFAWPAQLADPAKTPAAPPAPAPVPAGVDFKRHAALHKYLCELICYSPGSIRHAIKIFTFWKRTTN